MELEQSLNDRQKAFVMAALLFDKSEGALLAPYLSPHEQNAVRSAFDQMASKPKEEKRQIIIDQLKKLSFERRQTPLTDVHPDWMLDILKEESPRMVAAILRHLPGHQVAHILAHLPAAILALMPLLSETFSADPLLMQILRRKFEQNFPAPEALALGLSMEIIPHFPIIKLEIFFRELGFREVAMAFATLNEKTVNLLLRRLPPKDAASLKNRLEKKEETSSDRLSQAQSHLLSLDLDKTAPEHILLEAGFFVYTKALLPAQWGGARVMMKKFPKKLGEIFERYLNRNLPLNSEKTVARYRKEVGEALAGLQEEKK